MTDNPFLCSLPNKQHEATAKDVTDWKRRDEQRENITAGKRLMAAADRGPTARPKLARGRTDDAEQGSGRIHGKTCCCCCGRRRDDGWTADGGGRRDGRADSARRTQTARTGGRLQQPDPRRAEWTAAATGADREDEDGKRKRRGQPGLRRADPAQTGGDEAGRRRIEAAQVDGRRRRCRRRRRAATGWTEAPELLLLLRHYLKKWVWGGWTEELPPLGGKIDPPRDGAAEIDGGLPDRGFQP